MAKSKKKTSPKKAKASVIKKAPAAKKKINTKTQKISANKKVGAAAKKPTVSAKPKKSTQHQQKGGMMHCLCSMWCSVMSFFGFCKKKK